MLLRNYDNIMVGRSLPRMGNKQLNYGTAFGDGSLICDNVSTKIGNQCAYVGERSPFDFNNDTVSNILTSRSQGDSILIASSDDEEVTYDTVHITPISGFTYIRHAVDDLVYDEVTNTYSRTYRKVLGAGDSDIVINSIGVLYYCNGGTGWADPLIYKKKLDQPVNVPANSNVELSFTTKVSANPNKPANYDASAVVVK